MSANRHDRDRQREGRNGARIVAIVIVAAMMLGCAVPFVLAGL
ncbi:hypothetical protein [Bifidobacterium cuniculi]|nr:hypothetical protein [Bifidobacterium cuniculi]